MTAEIAPPPGVTGMELLFPTAISTSSFPTPSHPKSKTTHNPLLFSNANASSSFKTHLPSSPLSRIQNPRPLGPLHASSNGLSSSASSSTATTTASQFEPQCTHWMVLMDKPPGGVSSKSDAVDFYVSTLAKVLGSEKDAQMCIYDVSWQTPHGFCCDIDEGTSRRLSDLPGVLSVRPDTDSESAKKDYSFSNLLLGHLSKANGGANQMSTNKSSNYWLARMEKPGVEVVTKAQAVDYYAQILTKVLGKIRHLLIMKTVALAGLSFYTSEKTLRAAFEGFGELVEVKIIMDKISKRSKGYAFMEYTTEEAAAAALKEMNGKIINGWMIVVDVAKTNPPRHNRVRPRPTV
ncbi:chloroplast mRNA modification [Asimina triloba]